MGHVHKDLDFKLLQNILRRHATDFQHDIHARGGRAVHILGKEYTPSLQHLNIGPYSENHSTLMSDIVSENGKIARIWSGDIHKDDESYEESPGHAVQILVPTTLRSAQYPDSEGMHSYETVERQHFGGREDELHDFVQKHLSSPMGGTVTTYSPHFFRWETKENRPMNPEELRTHMHSGALAEEESPQNPQSFKNVGDLRGLLSIHYSYPKPANSLSMRPDDTPHLYDPRTEQLFGPDSRESY
jgi:hypothetical protein